MPLSQSLFCESAEQVQAWTDIAEQNGELGTPSSRLEPSTQREGCFSMALTA